MLTVVDDFTRDNIALVADTSLSGHRVRELGQIIASRGQPRTIVSDNGTEFTSIAILRWVQEIGLDWHYIAPTARQAMQSIAERGKTNPERIHRKLQRQAAR